VRARGTVARLAGDADVGDVRVEALVAGVGDRLQPRRDAGVVAEDAVHVPQRLVPRPVVVVGFEEDAVHVQPARLADVPQQRQPAEDRAAGPSTRSKYCW
jgi:hypothetical protein